MRAFLSDRGRRPTSLRAYAEHAVTEARRILAESEPESDDTTHATFENGPKVDVWSKERISRAHYLADRMAESLAAILPELDRLAGESK